jgi:hypothetical protein
MIKFHYHTARRDIPRLGVRRGARLCHVYSDTSIEELQDWGCRHGLRPEWIDGGAIPHFDAFGEHIELCGPGVGFRELAGDIRRWRAAHGRVRVTEARAVGRED